MLWQRTVATAHRHGAQRVLLYLHFGDYSPLGPCAGFTARNHICHLPFGGWKVGGAGARSRGRSGVLAVLCVVEMGAHGPVPSMPEILPRHSFDCLTLSRVCRLSLFCPLHAAPQAPVCTLTLFFAISPNQSFTERSAC